MGPVGGGLTIDGNAKNVGGVTTNPSGTRVFNIAARNETVSISNLTITDGDAKPAPNDSGNQGGDIFNSATLTLTNDVVSNGVATGRRRRFPTSSTAAAAPSSTRAAASAAPARR